MKYIYATAALFAALAAADGISYPAPTTIETTFTNEAQYTKAYNALSSDLIAFETSVVAQPAYTAFLSALSSAAGPEEYSRLVNTEVGGSGLISLATDTATPTWWTLLPTSAQAYATSVYAAEVSIERKDILGAAAATPAPLMRAAAVAGAGAIAGAALLL